MKLFNGLLLVLLGVVIGVIGIRFSNDTIKTDTAVSLALGMKSATELATYTRLASVLHRGDTNSAFKLLCIEIDAQIVDLDGRPEARLDPNVMNLFRHAVAFRKTNQWLDVYSSGMGFHLTASNIVRGGAISR